jgi:DNA-binding beta-propeller fold protein YncE
VAVDPSGKFAYVANAGAGTVSAFTIDTTTGVLTPIDADPNTGGVQNFAAGTNPTALTVDPNGKFVYVANNETVGSTTVSAFVINTTTGALTSAGTVSAGTGPSSLTVEPAG